MRSQKLPTKDRSWWPIIAAAVIGAIATIVAGLVANGAGALHISVVPATPTVTITPSPVPSVTVTVSSSASGGAGSVECLPSQDCKVWNLTVPMGSSFTTSTGINFNQGQVVLHSSGDMSFQAASDGTPELLGHFNIPYSMDVTTQNASRQQCQNSINSAPDADPITYFHTGLLFCIGTPDNGIALIRQTRPLGSSNILFLQETYWPAAT